MRIRTKNTINQYDLSVTGAFKSELNEEKVYTLVRCTERYWYDVCFDMVCRFTKLDLVPIQFNTLVLGMLDHVLCINTLDPSALYLSRSV